ncbi:hypothetical protein [Cryobacterium sp. PH31-L1]|uniref:hypothetical protein n=1 Tax=Cryobacterium sp. PH31-L1 TaxID=3046199 RepID=UPI0024BB1A5E|nr:hypothetical protein [Cryobacterium sp. PH31-L1]MDJ0377332.1 hypothetical protein [Cryobacterium sp. PH31-L1]
MTSARVRFRNRGSAVALAVAAVLAFGTLLAAPAQALALDDRPTHATDVIVGDMLTADVDLTAWDNNPDLTYVWVRIPADWSDGVPIEGATEKTYKVTTADIGSYVRVGVSDNTHTSWSNATDQIWLDRTNAQAGPVTIAGNAAIGETLTVDEGTWADGTVFTYQWVVSVDGTWTAIPGATSDSFVVTDDLLGQRISLAVTGTFPGSVRTFYSTNGTSAVTLPLLTAGTVTISGSPVVGSVLTATAGNDWPEGATLAYSWGYSAGQSGGEIDGATGATYTITDSMAGMQIASLVTATREGFQPAFASAFTDTVTAAQAPAAAAPVATSSELAAFLTGAGVVTGTAASAGLPADGLDVTKSYTATVDWAAADGFVDVYAYSTPTLVGTFPVVNGKVQAVLSPAMLALLASGSHTLVFTGQSSGAVQAVAFSISKTLAATGVDPIVPLGSAALLLLLGAALVIARRRRTLA